MKQLQKLCNSCCITQLLHKLSNSCYIIEYFNMIYHGLGVFVANVSSVCVFSCTHFVASPKQRLRCFFSWLLSQEWSTGSSQVIKNWYKNAILCHFVFCGKHDENNPCYNSCCQHCYQYRVCRNTKSSTCLYVKGRNWEKYTDFENQRCKL